MGEGEEVGGAALRVSPLSMRSVSEWPSGLRGLLSHPPEQSEAAHLSSLLSG